jgi:hypothetical protein
MKSVLHILVRQEGSLLNAAFNHRHIPKSGARQKLNRRLFQGVQQLEACPTASHECLYETVKHYRKWGQFSGHQNITRLQQNVCRL